MGHARARKIPAQLVEDEDYQLRHERVAGIDIAKAKADVCTRLPPARDGGRRASRLEEVPARPGRSSRWRAGCSPTGSSWSSWRRRPTTCDVMVHGFKWEALLEVGLGRRRSTRASARWPVSALACAAGNCGVRSPG